MTYLALSFQLSPFSHHASAVSFELYAMLYALGAMRAAVVLALHSAFRIPQSAFEYANFFMEDTLVLYKFVTIGFLSIRK